MGTTDAIRRIAHELGFPPDEDVTLDVICERARYLRECFEARFSDAVYARLALRECSTEPGGPPSGVLVEPGSLRHPSDLPKKIEEEL